MSVATLSDTTRSAAPLVRNVIRAIGFGGLGILGIVVVGANVFARAPAGEAGYGPSFALPSYAFPFGTDEIGRDVLSETIHALALTSSRALLGTLIVLAFGELLGFAAARLPFGLNRTSRWMARVTGAVPPLLLAVLAVALTSPQFAAIAAGLAAVPLAFARAYDRASNADRVANAEYARATGIPPAVLFRRDLTYEFRDRIFSIAARAFAAVTITLSTASFFGFGATQPARGLGLMIAASRQYYLVAWWTALFPALALLILILFARMAAGLEEGERP
jgi:peptide/nickel transport system permease protein